MGLWKYLLGLLILANFSLWLGVSSFGDNNLHIIACDVGQGDAILITYGTFQILTDGGPDSKVLGCLSKYIPFYDREIEFVFLTHPQTDHFTGLIEVFKRYRIKNFVRTTKEASTSSYSVLKSQEGGSVSRVIVAATGMVIRYDLIHLDIVWPPEALKSSDLNDYSIVYTVSFDDFEAIFTGDMGPAVTDKILATGRIHDVNYIKVPHHGSKNGLTKKLLDVVNPEIAVISVGKNNRYGHPHEEVLKLLSNQDVKILRTDEEGNIEVITDGIKWWAVGE